jgi:RNA polymerase sigma-70 factor (ECF subfamily)
MQPSPVVALNRAVAVAMHGGWAQGIALVDALLTLPAMQEYHLAHAARADLCRRAHRWDDARTSYRAALALTQLEPERRFLARRLSEIAPG